MVATIIVYDSDLTDQQSAEQIAQKTGFQLVQTPETKDPAQYDPLYDDNNLICIGASEANAYTKYYIFDTGLVTYNPTTRTFSGLGVYANGKRCILTVKRQNNTTVTGIFGVDAEDTIQAVVDFCKPKLDIAPIIIIGCIFLGLGIASGAIRL